MVMWVKQYPYLTAVVLLNLVFGAVAAAAGEDSADKPSMELLEFLGEFQAEDGEWIDPMELLNMEQSEKQRNDEDQSDE